MADATATRRSSRLAAQSKSEDAAPAPAPKPARKPTKKRSAPGAAAAVGETDDAATGSAAAADTATAAADADEAIPVPVAKKSKGTSEEASSPIDELDSIDIGDFLPSVTLKNEKDEEVDVSTLAAEKGVIFFLVPKADTPGCTTQACGFRDVYPDFTSSGFDVYCLSADSPTAQTKWQTKKNLPYPLLSDPKRVLIAALGAATGGKTNRSHFIFEKGGKLVDKKIPVKPADSPKLALEFVKSLSSGSA